MKKGFTIIEIIISVTIILIVGASATFFVVKKTNNNELESITKEILEAANAYIKVEKDNNGNIYANEIISGAKGVQIPLTNLVKTGYIKEEQAEKIKELTNEENYYIMFLDGNNESYDYCGEGKIFSLASWKYKAEDVYLCNSYSKTNKNELNLVTFNEQIKYKVDLSKYAVSEEYYNKASEEEKEYLTKDENGLYGLYNEETQDVYTYYRGAVDNNYLKFGCILDADGECEKDIYWRIVSLKNGKELKVILDETIPLDIFDETGKRAELNDGDKFIAVKLSNDFTNEIGDFSNLNGKFMLYNKDVYKRENGGTYDQREEITIVSDKIYSGFDTMEYYISESVPPISQGLYNNNHIHMKSMENWFNNTSLQNNSNIIENYKYCIVPSDNRFNCTNEQIVNSKIGFLTETEVLRAGAVIDINGCNSLLANAICIKTDLKNNGHYLSLNKNLMLSSRNLQYNDSYDPQMYQNYSYLNINGVENFPQISESGLDFMLDFDQESAMASGYTLYQNSYRRYEITIKMGSNIKYKLISSKYSTVNKKIFILNSSTAKPVIVIDLTNAKLSNTAGTKENPYTIIES